MNLLGGVGFDVDEPSVDFAQVLGQRARQLLDALGLRGRAGERLHELTGNGFVHGSNNKKP